MSEQFYCFNAEILFMCISWYTNEIIRQYARYNNKDNHRVIFKLIAGISLPLPRAFTFFKLQMLDILKANNSDVT